MELQKPGVAQQVKATKYDRHYIAGGFGYSPEQQKKWLEENTPLFTSRFSNKKKTLLDVGCGDGFWSLLLRDQFDVTAEDTSLGGVLMGSSKDVEEKVSWICADSRQLEKKYDIIFARGPSFFNKPLDDAEFLEAFDIIWERAKETLFWTMYSTAPFCSYHNGSLYHHDPIKLEEFLSQYGEASVAYKDNYIWAELRR